MKTYAILACLVGLSSLLQVETLNEASARPAGSKSNAGAKGSARSAVVTHAPPAVERRVIRVIEEHRARPDSAWRRAVLDPGAIPLYRPDLAEPAYWEFKLRKASGEEAGFAIVSAGEHDFPVPLSSEGGLARTDQVNLLAGVKRAAIVRYFMPVAGYVIAETAAGEAIVGPRSVPPKILGFERSWLDEPPGRFEGSAIAIDGKLAERRSAMETHLTASSWNSWEGLKRDYASVYDVPNAILRRNAARDWELEHALDEVGETLESGDQRFVPLLGRGEASLRVVGPASPSVRASLAKGIAGQEGVLLDVLDAPSGDPRPFTLELQYADGTREGVRYSVTGSIPAGLLASPMAGGLPPMAGVDRALLASWGRVPILAQSVAPNRRCSGRVILRVFMRGDIVQADPSKGAIAPQGRIYDSWYQGGWQSLQLVSCGAGASADCVAIKGAGDKYWSVKADNSIRADATSIGPAEKFTMLDAGIMAATPPCFGRTPCPDNQILSLPAIQLKASTGGYVTAKDGVTKVQGQSLNETKFFTLCDYQQQVAYWAGSGYQEAYDTSPRYEQIKPGDPPNTGPCLSGCGPTAWAILAGWADQVAERQVANHSIWAPFAGIYIPGLAPMHMPSYDAATKKWDAAKPVVDMIAWIAGATNSWGLSGCSATTLGNGSTEFWTHPVNMPKALPFFSGRGLSFTTKWDSAGMSSQGAILEIRDVLRYRNRPVIIGEGVLKHYSVAVGFRAHVYKLFQNPPGSWIAAAPRLNFEVNEGWGQAHVSEVPCSSWFQGWLHPNTNGWDTHGAQPAGSSCQTEINCASRKCDTASQRCL